MGADLDIECPAAASVNPARSFVGDKEGAVFMK